MKTVTLIPGDGIGTEIVEAVQEVFKAANAPIEWEVQIAGKTAYEKYGELMPNSLLESIERNKVALKGPVETPVGGGFKSINVSLRQKYDLYQNVRPCKNTVGINTRFTDVDLVLFRENTEGLYSGLILYDERLQIVDSISRISMKGCLRIVKAAFEYAKKYKRKKVTVVHKANILKKSGGMMLEAAQIVSKDYPDVEWNDKIIDNMCMQLVTKPEQFDVIVTSNLFGDILSDLCAGLVGGLGVVPGANIGDEIAIFEAVHGTAPDIAGKGIANPTAILRSAIMMLEYLGESEVAKRIDTALDKTLAIKELCTGDLGGKANTKTFTQNVIANLA
ncbi:isocitrate/isopropylmalate dehydrogenase family protein [Raineya orbicola]|jgi:isocitrate dehydrogenase (NAD+)|uniref:Isocitrate/isopropylmalate dehydrogenase n=1 Tax=Raineya orbicola TaxID=2016530 RepID=A0A2N3ICN4_9BACT|nr:isocitrate/isopropylmalate family dehydrogenase [Raineya orbicola]PKQ68035.1 Isocitrate/isopropylmalate dehydrogenase [Raineya orbicola]